MKAARRTLGLLALAALSGFFIGVKTLSDVLNSSDDVPRSHRVSSHAPAPLFEGEFRPVLVDAPLSSSAASGLAVHQTTPDGRALIAVANFYGTSSLYEVDARQRGLAPRQCQQFATKAAHDWTTLTLLNGRVQFVAAEYDALATLVYELNVTRPRPLADWPDCHDTNAKACESWSRSGECERNAGFMHTSCAASCGQCAALSGPLVAVQSLPGSGGTSVRHMRLPTESGRLCDVLLVANYKAGAGESVAVYEWRPTSGDLNAGRVVEHDDGGSGAWQLDGHIDVPGAGEFTHCHIPQTSEHLVVVSTWFANGSFAATSRVLALEGGASSGPQSFASRLVRRQDLPTLGSHDVECWQHGGETYLILGSGRRDDGRRDVPSTLYVYDWKHARRFREVQRLPTIGAHDFEVFTMPVGRSPGRDRDIDGGGGALVRDGEELVMAVANGAAWNASTSGDGESCVDGVDVYWWDTRALRFVPWQRLPADGCATFVRAWRAPGARLLLAVAIERTPAGKYDASVRVHEWTPDREILSPATWVA